MDVKYKFFIALLVLLWTRAPLVAAEDLPDESSGNSFSILRNEAIGALHYGMPRADALKYIAVKPKFGEIRDDPGAPAIIQHVEFAKTGIELDLMSDEMTGPQTVGYITVTAPSALKTKKGIHIGSSEAEVVAAYKEHREADTSEAGKVFVAGSVFGGLIFSIENGKVVQMFIGATAD